MLCIQNKKQASAMILQPFEMNGKIDRVCLVVQTSLTRAKITQHLRLELLRKTEREPSSASKRVT